MRKIYLPIIHNGMGLAMVGGMHSMVSAALSVLRAYHVTTQPIGYPYPNSVMNCVTELFLNDTDCEELVIIDLDVDYRPDHLAALLSHDVPLVVGAYPKKKLGLEFPIIPMLGETCATIFDKNRGPLVEIQRAARGFMRVHRRVFTTLDSNPNVGKVFDEELGKLVGNYWQLLEGGHSEDFWFCDRCRESGIKVMLDNRLVLEHEGHVRYPIKGTW